MGVMESDGTADVTQLFGGFEIGTEVPDDLSCFVVYNACRVCLAAVVNNIVGMKALVSLVVPLVGSQPACRVNVNPVAAGLAGSPGHDVVRIAEHGIARFDGESHFIDMTAGQPLPDNVSLFVHY